MIRRLLPSPRKLLRSPLVAPTLSALGFAALAFAALAFAALAFAGLGFAGLAFAGSADGGSDDAGNDRSAPAPAAVDRAVERGCAMLLSRLERIELERARGPATLALYALLESGYEGAHPTIAALLSDVAACPDSNVYESAVKILALGAAEPESYAESIERAARFLLSIRTKSGGFPYGAGGGSGDNSTTQFGLLGLWGAALAGVDVPDEVWTGGIRHYVRQGKTRGWGYAIGAAASTHSMTAAGLGSLHLCAGRLEAGEAGGSASDDDRSKWVRRARHRIERAEAQLGGLSAFGTPKWHFYYLYGIERAGAFSASDTIHGVDWYARGAAFLLQCQLPDGGWSESHRGRGMPRGWPDAPRGARTEPPPSELTTTAFAVLFLRRATARHGGGVTETPSLSPTRRILSRVSPQAQPPEKRRLRQELLELGDDALPELIQVLREGGPYEQRLLASDHLREVSGQRFGYDPAATPEENEAAIAKWERWLEQSEGGRGRERDGRFRQ